MRNPFARRAGARPFQPAPGVEVDTELAFHLEQRVQDYVARGLDPAAAREAALARFGNVDQVRSTCTELLTAERRESARRDWLGDLRQDLRYGVRALRRAPVFSLLAALTLALGIGANAAVFGVVKSVLLDALPFADADRVMRLYGRHTDGVNDRGPLSAGTVQDVRARGRSFARVAAFETQPRDGVFEGADVPQVVKVLWAEPELFRTLGVTAARGRLTRDDDAAADTAFNIVLTHEGWQRLAGGDERIVGRTVRINNIARTVVGVLPRGFVGPAGAADAYFPMSLATFLRDPVRARMRQNHGIVGRLRPDATPDGARREMLALGAELAREHPVANGKTELVAMPVREAMVGDTRTPLLVLMASAGLVLAVTCANLAGALLSRTVSRRKEFAVRAALGAGRGRLVRQLLTESTVLSLAGGAVGVGLAVVGLRALRTLASDALPPYAELALDGGALAVTGLLALLTGLAFGLVPALSVGGSDVQSTLREEGRATSEGTRARQLRGLLVAGQIALCVSLLAGAGLLARSLWAMASTPLGFDARGVLVAEVRLPPGARYGTPEGRVAFIEALEGRLRGLPGVEAVTTAGDVPTRLGGRNGVVPENAPTDEAAPVLALYHTVGDDYFRALRIPLRAGRTFGPQDRADGPPVVIVSERLAKLHWPGEEAVGKRLRMGPDAKAPLMEVIGVVGDVANDPARLQPELATYNPLRQAPWNGPVFLLRTRGDPAALAGAVRRAVAEQDPRVPLHHATPMQVMITDGLSGRRLPVLLMTAFGALTLLLASMGVYAMFASMAAAREREFGVRVALGSSPRAMAGLVLRQGARWMGLGLALGAVGVVAITRMIGDLLYAVSPFDPITLGTAVALLLACALVALLQPVLRATRVDPIAALR